MRTYSISKAVLSNEQFNSLSLLFFGLGSGAGSGGVDSLKGGWSPRQAATGSRAWCVCGGLWFLRGRGKSGLGARAGESARGFASCLLLKL